MSEWGDDWEDFPPEPADPNPMFRCVCVGWMADGGWRNDWTQRCVTRPTQEDGLCDHCRQTTCTDSTCTDQDGTNGWGCCPQPYGQRALVPLSTPCRAL